MKASLVIMAAGLGSRYGGEKQVDGIGPNGEAIMEYSVFDAVKAGFSKVVFIIKPHMLDTVKKLCGERLAQMRAADGSLVQVEYVFQDFSSIPACYPVPGQRVKPFGTIHAALCAKAVVQEPFALINADDYYGYEAYVTVLKALEKLAPAGEAVMVGYQLRNTVSDHGTVTRGVCIQENGALRKLKETYQIKKYSDGRICDTENPESEIQMDPNMLVSMNFWGATPWIFQEMERYFNEFLKNLSPEDLKAECLLPSLVDDLIHAERLRVDVLSSDAVWFGVTYREDREIVAEALRGLHESGKYPSSLRA